MQHRPCAHTLEAARLVSLAVVVMRLFLLSMRSFMLYYVCHTCMYCTCSNKKKKGGGGCSTRGEKAPKRNKSKENKQSRAGVT